MAIGPLIVHGLPVFGDGIRRLILRGLTTGGSPPPPPTAGEVAGRWVVPAADAATIDAGDLYKTTTDRRWYVFDYGNLPEIRAGYTLDNPSLAAVVSPLSVSTPLVVGPTVGTWIENGTSGVAYDLTVTVDFLDPDDAPAGTMQRTGRMRVV